MIYFSHIPLVETFHHTFNRCVIQPSVGDGSRWHACVVLAVIQEKLNNPSPDDPFEPDIAAVRLVSYGLLPTVEFVT
jgi:hypothetical protein